ncbi:MAG: hypothetical protein K0R54_6085 [Clostridiaceae bacterium]|nr:hypothetical protein [Clostridiaceae bacterium]
MMEVNGMIAKWKQITKYICNIKGFLDGNTVCITHFLLSSQSYIFSMVNEIY